MIEIDERVELPASVDEVWAVLSDPYQVVGLVADAEIIKVNDDGTYDGKMTIKFGPMRVNFMARVALDLDPAEHQGRITAQGKDSQGGTRMKTTANFAVVPKAGEEGTIVTVVGQVDLTGRLASQINAAAGVVVKRMSGEFSEALVAKLTPVTPEPAPPLDAGPARAAGAVARFFSGIISWFRRLLGRAK